MNLSRLFTLPFFGLIPCAAIAADPPPNIVVILADDLGYGDVRANNPERGKIPTPHMDRLAAGGMRFTDGHSSSGVCSPSRYTLLTGRYHWRSRLQAGIVGVFAEPLIPENRFTLANLAKKNGYRTGIIGKWHLGWDWPIDPKEKGLFHVQKKPSNREGADDESAPPVPEPQQAAWRRVFSQPIPGGPTANGFDTYFGTDVPNWPPFCFLENNRTVGIPSTLLPPRLFKGHLASTQGPALANWSLENVLPTLAERAERFVKESAEKPEPYFLYLPLTSPHTPLAVNSEWKGKSGLNTYADFVMETDAAVGRVLDAIERSGEAANTLVVLSSDNGCAGYVGAADLEKMGHFPSGPFRGYKASFWEGGHRVPFLVRWPAVVKPGTVCGQLVLQADLMATFAEILHSPLPESAGVDSFSLLPLLRGGDQPVRRTAVNCAASGVPSVRDGSWKLILGPESAEAKGASPVQLYNLATDLSEKTNLAAAEPERVRQMQALLEKLIEDGRSTPGPVQPNDVSVKRHGPAQN